MGRRVRKFISAGSGAGAASTVLFVYGQGGQLLGEYDSAGRALREYVQTPVAMFTPGALATDAPLVYFIHTDHLDTPRVVVDRSGALRWPSPLAPRRPRPARRAWAPSRRTCAFPASTPTRSQG